MNLQPAEGAYYHHDEEDGVAFANPCSFHKPRYRPGETVYIKEIHWRWGKWVKDGLTRTGKPAWKFTVVPAVGSTISFLPHDKIPRGGIGWHKRSPLFLPESLARSHALILSARPEQIQSITDEEIAREGIDVYFHDGDIATGSVQLPGKVRHSTARECFRSLWETLHKGSWEKNDWVWRYELEKK